MSLILNYNLLEKDWRSLHFLSHSLFWYLLKTFYIKVLILTCCLYEELNNTKIMVMCLSGNVPAHFYFNQNRLCQKWSYEKVSSPFFFNKKDNKETDHLLRLFLRVGVECLGKIKGDFVLGAKFLYYLLLISITHSFTRETYL